MSRNLSRWAVLYVWEKCINKELEFYSATFDKLICVRKINTRTYVGYFTVKGKRGNNFAQYNVEFSKSGARIVSACLIYWTYDMKYLISNLRPSNLIFDRRSDFSWIH